MCVTTYPVCVFSVRIIIIILIAYLLYMSVAYLKGFSGCSKTPLGFKKLD